MIWRIKFVAWLVLVFIGVISARAQEMEWREWKGKGEESIKYSMQCEGRIFEDSPFFKWRVQIENPNSKSLKCEVVMVTAGVKEVSEAVELNLENNTKGVLIFYKSSAPCESKNEVGILFNRVVYRKK